MKANADYKCNAPACLLEWSTEVEIEGRFIIIEPALCPYCGSMNIMCLSVEQKKGEF